MSVMTLKQIQAELLETSYRPGWRFEAYQHPYRGMMLTIYAEVIDSNTLKPVTLGPRHNIPDLALDSPLAFHRWLLGELVKADIHEVVEFYRVRGKHLHDPHDPHWPELGDPRVS